MKSILLSSALFGLQAAAFPAVAEMVARETESNPGVAAARKVSKARTNCGVVPCLTFNAQQQYVSTSGQYKYVRAKAGQIRGPCPGLNAAANHGYLDPSGVQSIAQTITGLGQAYGMTPDLAGFLAAYAVIFNGDPLLGTWSIGGPPPNDPFTSGLLGQAQGISYSHNVYEGDTSIARFDAYLNNGNAQEMSIDRWNAVYAVGQPNDRYTLDLFAQDFTSKTAWGIANNPYYFAAPFSTTLVSPAAYNFVINFMSNHTAAEPSGYLDGETFKQFFGVTGNPGSFKWTPGTERIPDNWYRRPLAEGYNAVSVFEDLGVEFLAYPNSFKLGGNRNGVNTFEGVSLSNITGGKYNNGDLMNYNNTSNAICFFSQFISAIIPDSLPTAELAAINQLLSQYITAIVPSGTTCTPLNGIDQTPFENYPGYKYDPTGPANVGGPASGQYKKDYPNKLT